MALQSIIQADKTGVGTLLYAIVGDRERMCNSEAVVACPLHVEIVSFQGPSNDLVFFE